MKQTIGAIFLFVCLATGIQAHCTTLPDACGPDKIQFDVRTTKHAPAPAPPAAGKAQIVFVELVDKSNAGACFGCSFTTRVGVDGAWVGANKGKSYFTVAVDPGEHHVCTDWQSISGRVRGNVGVASFSAEAGKVYYYQVTIRSTPGPVFGPPNGAVVSAANWSLPLARLGDDEGRYRVKISALATAKQKK